MTTEAPAQPEGPPIFRKNPISVSYTGWKRYLYTCPQQHFLVMTGQRPKHRDQRNFYRGIVLHQVLEDYLNNEEPPEWIAAAVQPTWERLLESHTVLWKGEADQQQMLAKALEWGQKLSVMVADLNLDKSKVEAEKKVERQFEVDGFLVRMNGKIDLLAPTADGSYVLLDLKASADKRTADPWQAVFYSILMDGYIPEGAPFVRHAGFIMPDHGSIFPYEVTQEQREWLSGSIFQMVRDIIDDKFEPRPDNSRCFMCDVKHSCPVVGGMMPQGRGRQRI